MIPDVLTYNLEVVFCGTAKGEASAMKGFYYAGPGNKFYGTLYKVGFTPLKLEPKDCFDINRYKIGLTDLVHTEFGNDSDISDSSYDVDEFLKKIERFQPNFVAFNGKTSASYFLGYRGITSLVDFGMQEMKIGRSQLYVLPSTSGSARRYWVESYWVELFRRINNPVN
ncbi:MAG: mismatch-specific DNA-glycosylase [Bacteroidales bacterium]